MNSPRTYLGNYIGGHFVTVSDPQGVIWSRNPGNLDEKSVDFPFCNSHVDEAVHAAKRSFPIWRRLTAAERYSYLKRYREILFQRSEALAFLDSFEIGKPLWESRQEIMDCLKVIDHFLQLGSQTTLETKVPDAKLGIDGIVRHFPIGVIAVVSQSVMPLVSIHHHFIPALLNGNTVVVKTTKFAPGLGQAIAECIQEAGLPAGAFNFLQGDGDIARRLTGHPEVDGVFFTGTPETTIAIKKQLLNDYWKIQVIQSGGKNASVVWNDCNYDLTLRCLLLSAFSASGQRYTSTSRIIVHRSIFDRLLKDFHIQCKKLSIGYGLASTKPLPFMGPLVSERLLDDYVRYQGIAVREGCEEIMRGKPLERSPKGYYVSPSIYAIPKADPKSVYQNSEFFGPQVSFYSVSDLDEAIEITNQTQFGLVSSLFSSDPKHFEHFVHEAKVGVCHWNLPSTQVSYKMPFVGLRKSGNMRPMGSFSNYQCTYPVSSLVLPPDSLDSFTLPQALSDWI
ncbi:MAG: aldehyde dehydrogenase family protein [Pseudomonadota bacterium]